MPNLKIGSFDDDKPVKVTVELPAEVNRDLVAYAEILRREGAASTNDPNKIDCAYVEALHGNGSRLHKIAARHAARQSRLVKILATHNARSRL